MAFTDRMKRRALSATTRRLLKMAAKASDENFLRLVGVLQRLLPKTPFYKDGIEAIRALVEERHQGLNAARRIVNEASPEVLACLVDNMVVGSFIEGYHRRYAFWEQYNVAPPAAILISPTMRIARAPFRHPRPIIPS